MQLQRTMKLKATGSGSADFFFLVSPGKIEQVKFVRGDDSLKTMADSLQKVDIGMKFPSDAQVKVLRRGTVRCGRDSQPRTIRATNATQGVPIRRQAGKPRQTGSAARWSG